MPETPFLPEEVHPAADRFLGRFSFEQAISCFYFHKSTVLQNIIHQFKYKNQQKLAVFMGRQMGLHMQKMSGFQLPDGLIPVPLHKRRYKERGYNQSELLCEGIKDSLHIPVFANLLYRAVPTRTQTKLNAKERWKNVKDAFKVKEEHPVLKSRSHVMLVDDVLTSGATLEACAHTLRASSPELRISVATLAIALY